MQISKTSAQRVHVSQVTSKFNPKPAANNKDCGPASAVMALRLLGIPITGAKSRTPQGAIDRIRVLSGVPNNTQATSNVDLDRAIQRLGGKTRVVRDVNEVLQAVRSGQPVILNGNAENAGSYGKRIADNRLIPFDGAHWIVVSGYDPVTSRYQINDPMSVFGMISVSPSELAAYLGNSIGIAVHK